MKRAVLIIEDEEVLAKNMMQYLNRQGFEVRAASSAEDGLAQLEQYQPEVILLDFHLPGMNGIQAIAKIRAHDRQIRTIMISGHGSAKLADDAMKAGAHDFLCKPVALCEIKRRLEKALG